MAPRGLTQPARAHASPPSTSRRLMDGAEAAFVRGQRGQRGGGSPPPLNHDGCWLRVLPPRAASGSSSPPRSGRNPVCGRRGPKPYTPCPAGAVTLMGLFRNTHPPAADDLGAPSSTINAPPRGAGRDGVRCVVTLLPRRGAARQHSEGVEVVVCGGRLLREVVDGTWKLEEQTPSAQCPPEHPQNPVDDGGCWSTPCGSSAALGRPKHPGCGPQRQPLAEGPPSSAGRRDRPPGWPSLLCQGPR